MTAGERIAKQYKCHHCCSCKKFRGKGMEGGGKASLRRRFLADQKIVISWKKCVLGHPIAWSASYCLLPNTFWLRASKNAFKIGSVKFAKSLSPPSILKKVRTGIKAAKGLKRCRAKVKGVNNPAWTASADKGGALDVLGAARDLCLKGFFTVLLLISPGLNCSSRW